MRRSSESIAVFAAALAKAQAELVNPEKSVTATIRTGRPGEAEQSFRYAPLASGPTSCANRLASASTHSDGRRRSFGGNSNSRDRASSARCSTQPHTGCDRWLGRAAAPEGYRAWQTSPLGFPPGRPTFRRKSVDQDRVAQKPPRARRPTPAGSARFAFAGHRYRFQPPRPGRNQNDYHEAQPRKHRLHRQPVHRRRTPPLNRR
jgi:hypothetical protein